MQKKGKSRRENGRVGREDKNEEGDVDGGDWVGKDGEEDGESGGW